MMPNGLLDYLSDELNFVEILTTDEVMVHFLIGIRIVTCLYGYFSPFLFYFVHLKRVRNKELRF